MISHVNFSSKLRNTNVLNSNVKNKKDNDKSSFENKNLLVMGLGALAISGIAFVMINKLKHPGKTGKDSQQISHKFFKYVDGFENFYQRQDESFQNIIDRQSSLKNEKVLKYIDIDSIKDFNIFRKIFEMNSNSKIFPYPKVVGFKNTDSQTTFLLTQLVANEYKWDFAKRKYNSANMEEFIEMLKKESEIEKKPRFIYIDNYKQMKFDIDKGSQKNKDIMQKVFNNNQKNNIIYITNDTDKLEFNDLTFIFKDDTNNQFDSIKNKIIVPDLNEYLQKINSSSQNTSTFISNDSREFFKSFLNKDYQKPVILTKFSNEKDLKYFVEEVNKYEKVRLVNFDCNQKKDLHNSLIQELEKQNNHFNIYGEKTYLHITNFEKYIDSDTINILKNANKDFNVMPLIEYKDNAIILKSFDSNYNFIFGKNFVYTDELAAQIAKRIKSNDLSHIEQNSFQYILASFSQPIFENGIILQGKSDLADITIKSLTNIFDMNYKKIDFSKDNNFDTWESLLKLAEQAKTDFETTGKRTFIELSNIDELLINFDTIENRRNIAKLKNFTENCAKNYNTTLIFHTTKDLDDFEPASIAPHRFGLKIKLI